MAKTRPPNKPGIIKDLKMIKKAMDARNIPFVLMYGLCLGYVRHRDVMEWDTDIDIGVFVELTEKQKQGMYKSLNTMAGYGQVAPCGDFIYGKKSVPLNLWLYHRTENYYKAWPTTSFSIVDGKKAPFNFVLKAKWFDKPIAVDFLGDKYFIPNNVFDYLTCHYGPWKKEIIKSHPKWLQVAAKRKVEWPMHEYQGEEK